MKKLFLGILYLAALCFLSGCTTTHNGFTQFYKDMAGTNISNLAPYSGTSQINVGTNPTNDVNNFLPATTFKFAHDVVG